ncbi:uncharacterized protein V1516DRAFT_666983 [Lipomyces oligophaga]|uniref:uncharacterized protein n=1 Tax=Lipomyces oligophaga TaxID=45792 RepID=UPI0034CF7708
MASLYFKKPVDPSARAEMTSESASQGLDMVATYRTFLQEDPAMTMPVAAIEALVVLLGKTEVSTASELIDILARAVAELKAGVKNAISLSAGCDMFQRFVLRNIQEYGDWEACKRHLVTNGGLFLQRAKESRHKIAELGLPFIRDDDTILIHSYSRAVTELLLLAARQHIRFKVFVTESRPTFEGRRSAQVLRENGIPTRIIVDSAVGYVIQKTDKVFVGAEGVAESGGIINRIGTYQIGLLAKSANKPLYAVAESHKFVRLFPLSPFDLPNPPPLSFSTEDDNKDALSADVDGLPSGPLLDFTSNDLITALITDIGVLTSNAVSEELIKMWYD